LLTAEDVKLKGWKFGILVTIAGNLWEK